MRYLVCTRPGGKVIHVGVHTWDSAVIAFDLVRFMCQQAWGHRLRELRWHVLTVV